MSGRRIALVAGHVVRAHVRVRVLYAVVALALVLLATALVVPPLSMGEGVKIVKDLGLALTEFVGVLVAVLVGGGLITRETDRRSILSLLSKPLPRWEFVVGEYAGLVLTIAAVIALSGTTLLAVLAFTDGFDVRLIVALLMITAESALLGAVALFFSAFSSSAPVAVALTVGVFVAGQLSPDLRSFGHVADAPAWAAALLAAVGWILPDFSSFDVKAQVVHGLPVGRRVVMLSLTYGALYVTALLAGAVVLFSRREFR
jgi:ABC-type transport system involved in multi-copper enzyme maturation permease subunit